MKESKLTQSLNRIFYNTKDSSPTIVDELSFSIYICHEYEANQSNTFVIFYNFTLFCKSNDISA